MTSIALDWRAVAAQVAAGLGVGIYRWTCEVPDCDGQPHDGNDAPHARATQRPPDGDWLVWLIRSGRGFGKTRTGAETLLDWAMEFPVTEDGTPTEWAIVGETIQDAREVCLLGPSGFIAALRRRELDYNYNKTHGTIVLSTGQKFHVRGADDEDVGRGLNLAGLWGDEFVKWPKPDASWLEGLLPALRQRLPRGGKPRAVFTTTPKPPTKKCQQISAWSKAADGSAVVTLGSTYDNAANLSEAALAELERQYGGSRLGRQELMGELLEDTPGALFKQSWIDAVRLDDVPRATVTPAERERLEAAGLPVVGRHMLSKVVVAVDPAVTYGEDADDTGIVVAGRHGTGGAADYFVLADRTCHLSPEGWARRVIETYIEFDANSIVAEANQGGEMVKQVILEQARKMKDAGELSMLPRVELVRATKGKKLRAEPVSTVYEQGRVHHIMPRSDDPTSPSVNPLAKLEDEMTSWTPDADDSPDRLDALVWAITKLSEAGGQVTSW